LPPKLTTALPEGGRGEWGQLDKTHHPIILFLMNIAAMGRVDDSEEDMSCASCLASGSW
jgi:hypothetical protein